MSSVGQDRAGTASGINNAVARVAGLLAVAILGIVMIKVFSYGLNRSLAAKHLPSGILQYIQSNEIKLAGLDLPTSLEANSITVVRALISRAFIFGFRTVLLICAGLSLVSSLVAWLWIPAKSE
jgi:hypothetical protein